MSLKRKIATYFLKRKLSNRKRTVKAQNLKSAKSIGILFEVGTHNEDTVIERFIESLKADGKKVYSIGFIQNAKEENDFKISMYEYFYTKKDLNWLGFPSIEKTGKFLARDFDILIDLCINDNFSTEYILSHSNAKLKVGKTGGYKDEFCDLLIDIKEHNDTQYLIEQIKNYLQKINTNEAA